MRKGNCGIKSIEEIICVMSMVPVLPTAAAAGTHHPCTLGACDCNEALFFREAQPCSRHFVRAGVCINVV